MNKQPVETLLSQTAKSLQHYEELERIKGERFNIFSILKMESAENNTHSNFIAELLNPKGSHLLGDVFLVKFLEHLNKDFKKEDSAFIALDSATTKVRVEYYVGKVDHKKVKGGRIDIYLEDALGKSISIENKIFAGDQKKQIERYKNHNKLNNTVLYLTLYGNEASDESKGELKEGVDYQLLSYREDILDWLYACLKESTESPILRESIKQYIILVQKLTHTMDKSHKKEIDTLILNNLDAALYIKNNTSSVVNKIRENFRVELYKVLKSEIKSKYPKFDVFYGRDVNTRYSQIWIKNTEVKKVNYMFGIESFSGWESAHLGGALFIGVFRNNGSLKGLEENIEDFISIGSTPWINYLKLLDTENEEIILSKKNTLTKLTDIESERSQQIITNVKMQAMSFISEHVDWVKNMNTKNL